MLGFWGLDFRLDMELWFTHLSPYLPVLILATRWSLEGRMEEENGSNETPSYRTNLYLSKYFF